jgi:hypothetical protein
VENQPLVRVSIVTRRWLLLLHCTKWSRARRAAAEMIASSKAVAGELLLYRRPKCAGHLKNRPSSDRRLPSGIVCRMVAWLPREPWADTAGPRRLLRDREGRTNPRVRNKNIEDIDIGNLRKGIHANSISFPSQVPILPSCGRPDLQRKLIQLYFVLGWSSAKIAARYGLLQQQVQRILKAWKRRAARAGYIQHIPPAEKIPRS